MIFVTLDALKKGLQNLFNGQRVSTNVEKVINFIYEGFSHTYLLTILKLEYVLCTNTLKTFHPIFLPKKEFHWTI